MREKMYYRDTLKVLLDMGYGLSVSILDASKILGVCENTIRKYTKNGNLTLVNGRLSLPELINKYL